MRLRRPLLSLLALGALAAPGIASGCAAGFDPPSLVNTLRIFAVVADKPYASPGEDVAFTMTYHDGFPSPEGPRLVQIVWLGGCFNPPGDQYFSCYEPMAELFESIASGAPPPAEYFAAGINLTEFTLPIPEDILLTRPRPEVGPHYGIAYLFFAACAGTLGPVSDPGGSASSFPIGCFDTDGRRLGSESFVPGYTQIYVFEDGRTNANPEIGGLTLDGQAISENLAEIPKVPVCPVSEEDRRSAGCGAEDPASACTAYDLEAIVDPAVVEIDPEGVDPEGQPLTEVVWVSYFADLGDLQSPIKLVNDAVTGFNDEHETQWIPPSEPGLATIWAVLRDARGGSSVVRRSIRVE
jgi:hypothetical protein